MRRLGKNNHLQSMERVNLHYRMHKSGKKWVFTMLFGLAMSTGLVSVNVPAHAHADTVNSEYTAVTKTSTDSGGLATKATTDTISVHYYILNADGSFELIQDNSGSYSTNLTGPTGDNVTKDITPLKIDGYDFVTYTDGPKQGNDIVFTGDIIYGDQGDIWLLYVPKGATSLLPEDPDSDGLTNSEENDIGTNPTNPDTDSDGKDDGEDEDPLTPAETASADLTINYVDVDNNNEIVYSEIDADHKVGGVVSYQPKLTAKELANYVFVDGEDTLRSVTMDADGETITVKVKQNDHVITQQTQTWYVAYEGLDDSIVPDSAKQTITWTVDTNVTTGEKTYSTDDKFTSVDSPVIAGYTADQASVAAPEIGSTPDEDSYATVTYTKDVDPDDPDSDGLTSEEESEAGTDPDNPDTDSDGVNDSDDVKPLDPTISDDKDDPDSDNLTSEEESEAGTDPDNSDTDGDGVNDSDDVKPLDPTISDDKDDPDSDNLTSEEESEAGTDPDNSDTDSDGVNDSDDVKPLDPTISDDKDDPDSDNLTSEEESEAGTDPDNSDTDGDSVNDSDDVKPLDPTISDDKDDPDSDNLTSEEESEAGTDPDNSDTDGDGVNDSDDVKPLDPTISDDKDDPDSDGLSNSEEAGKGTDPTNSDTDGDGINDSEDAYPLDPNNGVKTPEHNQNQSVSNQEHGTGKLPQTDEKAGSSLSVVGLILSALGLFGLGVRRKKEDQ